MLDGPREIPFTVGAWIGSITDDSGGFTIGEVTNGTVAVAFITTLDIDAITTLLAGLVPFDPPTPINLPPTQHEPSTMTRASGLTAFGRTGGAHNDTPPEHQTAW